MVKLLARGNKKVQPASRVFIFSIYPDGKFIRKMSGLNRRVFDRLIVVAKAIKTWE